MFDKFFSSLGRLVGTVEPDACQATETERRVWVRYPCRTQIQLQAAGDADSETFSARLLDISRGGIGLVVDRELEPGRFLSVELPMAEGEGVSRVLAYVLHVNANGPGEWAVGCNFSDELADDDLQALGARREKPAESDQRSWVRFPCPVRASFQVVREDEPAAQTAGVVDISPTGIGLQVEHPLDVGTLLSVELHGPGEQPGLTILASVVRARSRAEGQWTLGCSFIRELSESELQALL